MLLGVEIGGTKLQLAVGDGLGGRLAAVERREVDRKLGAQGILDQLDKAIAALAQKHAIELAGVGFGGPVDAAAGRVRTSHQVEGWDDAPLADWFRTSHNLPIVLVNDCDAAAVAEARFGAGRGAESVFYVTVGTGVGGGFVADGKLYGAARPAVAEIGHLRPGLIADRESETVESLASGLGIAAAARARMSGDISRLLEPIRRDDDHLDPQTIRRRIEQTRETGEEYAAELLDRAGGDIDAIDARLVAQAAADGNPTAMEVIDHAVAALGWAIAQTITLLAPEVVVVGGGVSLISEALFLGPLREQVARYVFPPLRDSYEIRPAALGEEVVLHGALALAADAQLQ